MGLDRPKPVKTLKEREQGRRISGHREERPLSYGFVDCLGFCFRVGAVSYRMVEAVCVFVFTRRRARIVL